MGAHLDTQLKAAAGDPDRLADGAGVDAAADIGTVDGGEDLLVMTGAFSQVGVEVDRQWPVFPVNCCTA
jgi:hypothetical protein